jgi:predicted ABC-type ATPase
MFSTPNVRDPMLYEKLSDLTPAVVDSLYNIDRATPVADPTFLFLVGVPGSGKSSMYGRFDNHAIINIDTLLESLLPFRAASSMSQYMQQQNRSAKTDSTFTSIGAYGTHKENLGMFKWYDAAPHGFHRVRERFQPLSGHEAPHTLNDLTSFALARAITKHVNIIYETTITSSKKVDDIMYFIKKHTAPYRVHVLYVKAAAANVAARVRARQENGAPQENYPFYRYVPDTEEFARKQIEQTEAVLATLRKKYKRAIRFEVVENPLVAERLPAANRRSASTRRRHILRAYGSTSPSDESVFRLSTTRKSQSSNKNTRPSLYVSSPSSERRKRLTVRNK